MAERERLNQELSQMEKREAEEEKEGLVEEMDKAQQESEDLQHAGREEFLKKELESVEHTLKKIEEGKFGFCEKGGEEISHERLTAMPMACLCMNCKMICENCSVEIEESRVLGKTLPARCQNCEEEFEPEVSFTSSSITPQ